MNLTKYPVRNPYTDHGFREAIEFFKMPGLVARRLAEVLPESAFLSHYLLSDRQAMPGGALIIEPVSALDQSEGGEQVAPGAEYPPMELSAEDSFSVESGKFGGRRKITTEALSRVSNAGMFIDRQNTQIVNQINWAFERPTLAAVHSAIGGSYASKAWDSKAAIIHAVESVKAQMEGLLKNFNAHTLVMTSAQWANAAVVLADMLPDGSMTLVDGNWPNLLGLTVVTNPFLPAGWQPTLIDLDNFGGIGHEQLSGDGYVGAAAGTNIEVKVYTEDASDSFVYQWRKTDVPFITNKDAAVKITGTGL